MSADYYTVLNIERSATQREVRRAYRKLALERHPDRNPETRERAERDLKLLNEAYHVLSDPDRRRSYDRGERLPRFEQPTPREHPPRRRPRKGGDLNVRTSISKDEAVTGFVREIVLNAPTRCDDCGGTGASKQNSSWTKPKVCSSCRGLGCRTCFGRGILLPLCNVCRGHGAVEKPRRVTINVPSGVESGARIRIRGQGMPSVMVDGPSGDLLIELHVV